MLYDLDGVIDELYSPLDTVTDALARRTRTAA